MAGNRVGKTFTGAFEVSCHLTGQYPSWWNGKRFDRHTNGWTAGKTNESTRDILQFELFGKVTYVNGKKTVDGTGMIPLYLIDRFNIRWKQGVADLIDTINVKHVDGGWSTLGLKSYQQGRGVFEGTTKDFIHLDEECPTEIYTECLTRTATTDGTVLITFTPLDGLTPMIKDFKEKAAEGVNYLVQAGWADAPHLTEQAQMELKNSYPEHEHDARMRGLPIAGSGVIFSVPNEMIIIEPFDIPSYWPMIIGMDYGWDHPTAAILCAYDPDADIFYLTGEYAERKRTPDEHAPEIKALCSWANIAWPADGINTDKTNGMNLADMYRTEGLNMLDNHATFENGSRSVEAGIQLMLSRMKRGKFKVFKTCQKWIAEKQQYSRKDGEIIKKDDDCIDASRYALMCLRYATTKPVYEQSRSSPVRNKVI